MSDLPPLPAWAEGVTSNIFNAEDMRAYARTAVTAERAKHVASTAEPLQQIKDLVCGDKHPRWSNDDAVYTTRGVIADLCDIALGNAPAGARPPVQPTEPK